MKLLLWAVGYNVSIFLNTGCTIMGSCLIFGQECKQKKNDSNMVCLSRMTIIFFCQHPILSQYPNTFTLKIAYDCQVIVSSCNINLWRQTYISSSLQGQKYLSFCFKITRVFSYLINITIAKDILHDMCVRIWGRFVIKYMFYVDVNVKKHLLFCFKNIVYWKGRVDSSLIEN